MAAGDGAAGAAAASEAAPSRLSATREASPAPRPLVARLCRQQLQDSLIQQSAGQRGASQAQAKRSQAPSRLLRASSSSPKFTHTSRARETLAASSDKQQQPRIKTAEAAASQPPADSSNSRRVPTFGSTPQRVTRIEPQVPYFSYYGRARNVELLRPGDRQTRSSGSQNRQWSSSVASCSSSSARSASSLSRPSRDECYNSSASSSAEQSEILSSKRPPSARARSAAGLRLLKRGYSNISNLFPGKPAPPLAQQQGSDSSGRRSSLTILATQQLASRATDGAASAAHNSSPRRATAGRQGAALSRSTADLASGGGRAGRTDEQDRPASRAAMIRQNSSLNSLAKVGQDRSNSGQQQQQQQQQRPSRHLKPSGTLLSRPASATGLRRRSPSASSLYRAHNSSGNQQSRQLGPHYVGAWTYELDPDCPVHGQSGGPCSPGGAAAAAMSRSSQHLHRPTDRNRSGGSLYSPSSPPAGHDEQRPASAAYYNGASRFSLYSGGSGGADSGRPRSSLAPAHEQVRRILGYAPRNLLAPKPVYLHPQWAYNRPFIHLLGTRAPALSPELGYFDDDDDDLELALDNYDDIYTDEGKPQLGASRQPKPRFAAFNQLQDAQAIRAVDFHPSGQVYAIGSNSRALRICAYPAVRELRQFSGERDADEDDDDDPDDGGDRENQAKDDQQAAGKQQEPAQRSGRLAQPRVLFKFLQVHRGSIYCVAFNASGQLLATGSNDQTVHLVRYNPATHAPDGDEFRLAMHDGTVRELCFIDDSASAAGGSSLLLSAGGGDNKIYVTDCETVTPFQSMAGHTHSVMGLHHVGGAQFVSCSQDRTIRFWDLRTRGCTAIISAPAAPATPPSPAGADPFGAHRFSEPLVAAKPGPGAPVCAVRADPSGRLLVSGHSDATCMLYDIRAGRIIQAFRAHRDEVRSVSFSPKAHYMLTGGYDGRLVLTDLQGDLSQALPSACVAQCQDKVVQAKWHPTDYTFVSTSADRTATLWALPAHRTY